MRSSGFAVRIALLALGALVAGAAVSSRGDQWTREDVEILRSLWIGSLEALPPDPGNRVGDDPRAAELGRRLFFDARLSGNGSISCASCHTPERDFQDGTRLGHGIGTTTRRTMPIAGSAHAPFLFWDGRKDSQWAQALGPLESAVEHGGTRAQYAHVIAESYAEEWEPLFGPLPSLAGVPRRAGPVDDPTARMAWEAMTEAERAAVTGVYASIGKAIAAYERRVQFGPGRFDRYVEGLVATGRAPADVLSEDEVAGLRLFIGKASCVQCHNGPLLTNNEFHNTGVPEASGLPVDRGRADGARQVLADEFNCRSRWSDAQPGDCVELDFLISEGEALKRAYKPPSLRNVAERAPYMHAGQFATLEDVLAHYNLAPAAPAGHTELRPLHLSARELRQLEAWLHTLTGTITAPTERR